MRLFKVLDKWDELKKSYIILSLLVFFVEIKHILETIVNVFEAIYNGYKMVNWKDVVSLPNESWIDFVVKVVIVYMFYSLGKSIKKMESSFNDKINLITNNSDAAILHVQANHFLVINQPIAGIQSLIMAVFLCIKSENYVNAQNEIDTITSIIKNKAITVKHLKENGIDMNQFDKEIQKADSKRMVTEKMADLMKAYNEMTK